MKASIRDDNPVIFIEHKLLGLTSCEVPDEEYIVPLGKANVAREGKDVTVVAIGKMVGIAHEVAKLFEKEGIEVEIIDPLTISPLDKDTIIKSVKKTGRVVISHEAVEFCGMGAEIAAIISKEAFFDLNAPIERVAGKFAPAPYNPGEQSFVMAKEEDMIEAIKKVLQ